MVKANLLKISLGILIFIVIIFSFLIFRNYQEGYGCMDCIIERTLIGNWYDGWQKSSNDCIAYQFDKESSLLCFNSNLPWEIEEKNIIQSEIKIPSIKLLNTILTSKNLPAFIIEGEGCRPSFAIISDGSMYSTGGCLG